MSAFHLLTVVQDAITLEFAVRLSASVRRDENAAYRMRCFFVDSRPLSKSHCRRAAARCGSILLDVIFRGLKSGSGPKSTDRVPWYTASAATTTASSIDSSSSPHSRSRSNVFRAQ